VCVCVQPNSKRRGGEILLGLWRDHGEIFKQSGGLQDACIGYMGEVGDNELIGCKYLVC